MTQAYDQEALFASAHNALLFAFNFSDQQYDRPLMSKMADGPMQGVSKGLSGMDGAAQAGMIMSRLMQASPLSQYIIFARYAPADIECKCDRSCCVGRKPNELWEVAIAEISRTSISQATPGAISHRQLRNVIMRKLFGAKVDLLGMAEKCGVRERVAYEQQASVKRWLDGSKVSSGEPDEKGVRVIAYEQVNRIFTGSGIVGPLD